MLLLALPAHALELKGEFAQGGFVAGKVAPGSTVILDRRNVVVGPDGSFALGFTYDAEPTATLTVRASTEQFWTETRFDVADGQVATWDAVFEDVVLRGRVVEPANVPAELLRRHGVVVGRLDGAWRGRARGWPTPSPARLRPTRTRRCCT